MNSNWIEVGLGSVHGTKAVVYRHNIQMISIEKSLSFSSAPVPPYSLLILVREMAGGGGSFGSSSTYRDRAISFSYDSYESCNAEYLRVNGLLGVACDMGVSNSPEEAVESEGKPVATMTVKEAFEQMFPKVSQDNMVMEDTAPGVGGCNLAGCDCSEDVSF